MTCMNCGKELKENALFCSMCGTPVQKTAAQETAVSEKTATASIRGNKKVLAAIVSGAAAMALAITLICAIGSKTADGTAGVVDAMAGTTAEATLNEETVEEDPVIAQANAAVLEAQQAQAQLEQQQAEAQLAEAQEAAYEQSCYQSVCATLDRLETGFSDISTDEIGDCFHTKIRTGLMSAMDGMVNKVADIAGAECHVQITPYADTFILDSDETCSLEVNVQGSAKLWVLGKTHRMNENTTVTMTKVDGEWLVNGSSIFELVRSALWQ